MLRWLFLFSLPAPSSWWCQFPHSCASLYLPYCVGFLGLPQPSTTTGWLNTTEMYSLTVFESRSSNLRCQKGHTPSEGSREESFACSWLLAWLGLWLPHRDSSLCPPHLHVAFFSISASSLPLRRTPVTRFSVHPKSSKMF